MQAEDRPVEMAVREGPQKAPLPPTVSKIRDAYRAESTASGGFAAAHDAKSSHRQPNYVTIANMGLAIFAMRVLEVMFFVGAIGSAIVIVISFIEDWQELFGKD